MPRRGAILHPHGWLALAVSAWICAGSGCRSSDTVAFGGDGGAAIAADAALWESYCDGSGPPVLVGDGGDAVDVCSGDIAEATFEHAVCSCEDLALSAALVTDSFDSNAGPYTPGGTLGSVASNGAVRSNATMDIRGDLTGAGAGGVSTGISAAVLGNLASGADLGEATAAITVGGDASVAGDISLTDLTVNGSLTVPLASTLSVSGTASFGTLVRSPVTVDPPCECASEQLLDVAGYVRAHQNQNYNDTIPITPDHLVGFSGPTELALPCGLYYLSAINGTGALTIRASGRVALFVDGSVQLDDLFTVTLDPGAELDLFIAGNVTSSAALQLGDANRPSSLRIYLGAAASLDVSASSSISANLYAPQTVLNLSGAAEIFGAVFVRRIASSSGLMVHYDERVRTSGTDCPIVN
jgi:hypothetical protein